MNKHKNLNELKKIDFSEITENENQILKSDQYKTLYRVSIHGKDYAYKIQHIKRPTQKLSISNSVISNTLKTELSFYKYINGLNKSEQVFFTKLYGYEFDKNCKHKQQKKRQMNEKKLSKYNKRYLKIINCKYCVKFLLEYKGTKTLQDYLLHEKLTAKKTYSILLQLYNIYLIMYKGGYSYYKIEFNKIMVTPTKTKYFMMLNKKVPYCGIQLSANLFDYTMLFKFKKNKKNDELEKRNLYNTLYNDTSSIIFQMEKFYEDCNNNKKKFDINLFFNFQNAGIQSIIKNHPTYYKNFVKKYTKIYPNNVDFIHSFKHFELTSNKLLNFKNEERIIFDRFYVEFGILNPKLQKKYFKNCSYYRIPIHKKNALDIIRITNTDDLIKYVLNNYT